MSLLRQLVRRTLRVWDPHPQLGLEFYWEPAPGEALPSAAIVEGRGTLTWRGPGTSNYDLKSIYSFYRGDMLNGRPEGRGRLETAAGSIYDGEWSDGQMHGKGRLRFENGDEYIGAFQHGKMQGQGVHISANGEVYEGAFQDGRRHGLGTVTTANGSKHEFQWLRGNEVASKHAPVLVQLGASNPADITIAVAADAEKHAQIKRANVGFHVLTYSHQLRAGAVDIIPDDTSLMSIWKGGGKIYNMAAAPNYGSGDFSYDSRAFIKISISAKSSIASVRSLKLAFARSRIDPQPFLGVERLRVRRQGHR